MVFNFAHEVLEAADSMGSESLVVHTSDEYCFLVIVFSLYLFAHSIRINRIVSLLFHVRASVEIECQ